MAKPHLHFTSLAPRDLCGDIVETYRLAAQRLGYPTSYADGGVMHPGAINVLFFGWGVPWKSIAPYHPNCIVVNFEPMVPGTHAWSDAYLEVLHRCYLWEYSQSNFQRNRELGLRRADHVPLAYEDGAAPVLPLADILPDAEQDIDVVFFGTLTQRRIDILHALMARGLRVVVNRGVNWSTEERDGYLRRAKLALNFHNWDDSRMVEIGRLSILFRQRKAVVCELYPDSEIEPALRGVVAGAPYDGLVDTVLALLSDPPRRAALERAGLQVLQQFSQAALVGPALERFLRWRAQQLPLPEPPPPLRVAACMHIEGDLDAAWQDTLAAVARSEHAGVETWITHTADGGLLRPRLAALGLADAHCIAVPAGLDAAAARNLMLRRHDADAVVFYERGDIDHPSRLQRLAGFLAAHPDVDIVGHWSGAGADDVRRCAEMDHEIKADLLGPQPLRLERCMLRRRLLDQRGVRIDAEFLAHGGLHFLCKCAAADARFAALPEVLQHEAASGAAPGAPEAGMQARAAAGARRPLLSAAFPHLRQDELGLLGELHAAFWAPDPAFAGRVLAVLAKACIHAPGAHGTERETLTRVLRHEAVRVLHVFDRAKLIDQAWMDTQFAQPDVAWFLAPATQRLPMRPGVAARA